MKRSYKIKNLGCANCAAKMEHDINNLAGVEQATVNFMTQRLTLIADDARFAELVDAAEHICQKYEPETSIAH